MQVISVSRANCKNCYRCVRHCPVKAVKISGGQAEVVEDLCVFCGRCIIECPQNAKKVKSELEIVKEFIKSKKRVIASIAPSYPAAFDVKSPCEMYAMLKNLGFCGAEETAVGAELVSREFRKLAENSDVYPIITTACPVVKNLVEKYHPALIKNLASLVSPMVAHARSLKKRFGKDVKVVFIGPCVAKKAEARDCSVSGEVDAVLTFQELKEWLSEENKASKLENVYVEEGTLEPFEARNYPLPGGLLKTSLIKGDFLSEEVLVADGIEECKELLDAVEKGKVNAKILEMMACSGGCLGGPMMPRENSLYERRAKLLYFIRENRRVENAKVGDYLFENDLGRTFERKVPSVAEPTEEEIKKILYKIGKTSPEKELNCGACGYSSCREKAAAVFRGMAEVDMCIPYMRSRAESLANLIIDNTPNAVILVDKDLKVREINKAGERMLGVEKEEVLGRTLSDFMDDRDVAWVLANKSSLSSKKENYPRDFMTVLESILYIEDAQLALVIMQDITEQERQRKELERVREETVKKAQEVINKQMRVAQEIAGLLGETTAESKVLLLRLIELVKSGGKEL
ncbi:PAS domain S-box protein [Thermovorax subterraneus]|nr:PAS domain S-box protein [Thermovorax subterraneus]